MSGLNGQEKRGFLEGDFCKNVRLFGCAALSSKCTAGPNILLFFSVSWSVPLGPTETPSYWLLRSEWAGEARLLSAEATMNEEESSETSECERAKVNMGN